MNPQFADLMLLDATAFEDIRVSVSSRADTVTQLGGSGAAGQQIADDAR